MPFRERTIGPYRLGAKLGEGGMGEVWQATDTRLKREVAVKLLPSSVAGDALRLARFEREAQVLASLNHPGIAAIYGVEDNALVMELVPGETLAERIGGRALEFDDAMAIARQIAEALAYAHDKGVVHRDLKPANIKITPEGQVKILDFGLAKAMSSESGATSSALDAPTLTTPATLAGTVLGTAAYMAPEQARGQNVDRRADIWAFGVVLYEMLTGERPFGGPTVSDTLAAVLKEMPEWQRVPAPARRLLEICLEKDPRKRLGYIGDALLLVGSTDAGAAEQPASRRRGWLPWAFTAAMAAAAIGFAFRPSPARPGAKVWASIGPPAGAEFDFSSGLGGPVLSPDGRSLVISAINSTGDRQLWLRSMDSGAAHPLPGTEGAMFPFWSPDSRSIAFFASGELQRTSISGGAPQVICPASGGRGGSWSPQGVIVFAPRWLGGLERVPAAGGAPQPLHLALKHSGQAYSQRFPDFLPDGEHFIFWAGDQNKQANFPGNGIYLASLDSSSVAFLVEAGANAVYAAPGYLLFRRQGSLMAQPFDAGRLRLTGEAQALPGQVGTPQNYRLAELSVSQSGLMVFSPPGDRNTQVEKVDGHGNVLAPVGTPASIVGIRLSPDGATLAEVIQDPVKGLPEIWLTDLRRDVRTQLTFKGGNLGPVWSPNGRRIALGSTLGGQLNPWVEPADGSGQPQPLWKSVLNGWPMSWSPDGRNLAVSLEDSSGSFVLWNLPVSGGRKPYPLLPGTTVIRPATFSPDGKWLAYASDASGAVEIYLTRFPGGGRWQVSRGGGLEPEWNSNGRTIYYSTAAGKMMAVSMSVAGSEPVLGEPKELFSRPLAPASEGPGFQVLPGGGYLLLVPEQTQGASVTVVSNWATGLRR